MTVGARFEHLAAIRGAAAFVVLLTHIVQIFWLRILGLQSWPHIISSEASYYAVVTFFVLSGFLIAHSVESNKSRNSEFRLAEFFAARFARLYPPFLFAIALSAFIYFCFDYFGMPGRGGSMRFAGDSYSARDFIHLPPIELLSALLMGYGLLEINGPLWSLYVEAKLYVLFGCIQYLWAGRRSLVVVGLLVAIAYAGLRFNPEFARYSAIWLVGCCAYYMWEAKASFKQWPQFVLCVGIVILIAGADLGNRVLEKHAVWMEVRAVWIDIAIACAIASILFRFKLGGGVGRQFADYSYSLYATHFPILLLFQSILVGLGNTSIGAALAFSMVGGLVSLGVARIGGQLEATKDQVQRRLLASWTYIAVRPHRAK